MDQFLLPGIRVKVQQQIFQEQLASCNKDLQRLGVQKHLRFVHPSIVLVCKIVNVFPHSVVIVKIFQSLCLIYKITLGQL